MDFTKRYDEQEFKRFLSSLLPDDFYFENESVEPEFTPAAITSVERVGRCDSLDLNVYYATHRSSQDARVSISRDIFRVMAGFAEHRALVAFVSSESNNWRLSLATIELSFTDQGKPDRKYSNPRRYSYLLGAGAKIHTPQSMLSEKITDFEDLTKRFSLEVVNKEFYASIAMLFTELTGGKRKIGNREIVKDGLLKYPQGDKERGKNFAVRLLGRLVFCWFLKKKALISDDVLSKERVQPIFTKGLGYYHGTLEPLFFEVLNTKIADRKPQFKAAPWSDVPFLNGGLFSPHYDDFYAGEPDFSLKVPDEWFEKVFELFETYNFTVDESTSVDIELAIDPEMLGRIFENLLAEIVPETGESARNSTGSFYTPRQIVDYMVDTSLKNYLYANTNIDKEKINLLFEYDCRDLDLNNSEKKKLIDVLHKIKVLDPAAGSGAYPMGILQKMLFILQRIDPDSKLWLQTAFSTANPLIKQEIEKKINTAYIHKLGIIQNSIYGVDIQPIAAEISKLRVFLSLIVDETIDEAKPNRGIEPLPNLEFKFVCANTLVKLPTSATAKFALFDEDIDNIEKLKAISERYFTTTGDDKKKIIAEFEAIQRQMFEKCIHDKRNNDNNRTNMLISWKPFKNAPCGWFDSEWMFGVKDGFDVVIGNPPYIQLQTMNEGGVQKLLSEQGYKTFAKTGDIYCIFYERGFELLAAGGYLCYITSNKWMRAKYGEKLRSFFAGADRLKRGDELPKPVVLIDFGGYKVFESATVDTNILLTQKIIAKAGEINEKKCQDACAIKADFTKSTDIAAYTEKNSITLDNLSGNSWIICSAAENSIRQKIEAKGVPLKDWDISINMGIKTGYDKAFIIDGAKKDELIKADPKNAEIIKPILRGRDIKKYKAEFADKWIIATFPALHIDIDDYPAIRDYLKSFGRRLEQVGEKYVDKNGNTQSTRKKTGNKWFETQDQIAYYSEFEKEKIVYTDISQCLTFTFDNGGMLMSNTCYFLNVRESNKYALTILNSKLLDWYYRGVSAQLGSKGIRHFSIYIELLPVPQLSEVEQVPFVELVDKIILGKAAGEDTSELERRIDKMVYELYGLSEEEIRIVEGEGSFRF